MKRKSTPLQLSIMALSLAAGASSARGDEAFVCDAGRIVYVKPGDSNGLKLNDPCIKSYFGEKAPIAAPQAVTATVAQQERQSETAVVKVSVGTFDLQQTAAAAPPRRLAADRKAARQRPLPVASPDTDFRNVRIINAEPGAMVIYYHRR